MAGVGITLDTAAVLSTAMEGILYGFSVLMFMGTIWTLTCKCRMKDINRPIIVVAVLLLMLSTAHMVVDIIRVELGLVTYRDTFPGGPAAFFADSTQAYIYRCYVVWQSIWVIIFPSMLLFSISHATSEAGNIYAKATGQWIIAYYAMTLTTNLWASAIGLGLLAYRIWMTERNVSAIRATKSTTMPIVRVLVDAAILYSMALFSVLVGFVLQNNGQYILLDMIMPVISIAFYMVLIRIAINKGTHNHFLAVGGGTDRETAQGNSRHHPTKPLQVHISQLTHNDLGYGIGNQDRQSTKAKSVEGASYAV
ncbi:hypothetical protein DFH29DRAFT_979384 [Suillus ampliporus]|nr:hypothetical protein DFH29DRAFT_979384 [Suillus ampliporus]